MPKVSTRPVPERKVFVSYSHADIAGVRQLLKWLRPICKRLPGGNEAWVDYEQLKGGDEWNPKILQAIEAANVFIVVMSIDYVDSMFCIPEELRRILAKRAAGQADVFGILLRTAELKDFSVALDDDTEARLSDLQCLPQADQAADGERRLGLRAIQTWPQETRDEAWNLMARQLESALGRAGGGMVSAASAPAPAPAVTALMSPVVPAAGLRLSAQWLPYLADRDQQCMALLDGLERWTKGSCRRPLVVLTEGRSHDSLPKWVERLHAHELVSALSLGADAPSFGNFKSFAWPAQVSPQASVDEAQQQFQRALACCLGPKPLSPISEVVNAYQTRQRPTLLWVPCQDKTDTPRALRALSGLLQVLADWPDLGPSSMLVVAINLERDAHAAPGERARLAADFEAALSQAEAKQGVIAAALGSLPELDANDIVRWAQDHAADHLSDDVYALCGRLPPNELETWPMRTFAEAAREWLANR